jgi:hypothetical protein
MVWVTPDTAVLAVIVPAEVVEQEYAETTAVPLELAFPVAVLLKEQLGVVFKVKAFVVPYVGVPVAVSTIF